MIVLTPAERRAVLLVVGLLVAGTLVDVWEAHRSPVPLREASPPPAPDSRPSDSSRVATLPAELASPEPRDAPGPGVRPRTVDLNGASLDELDQLPGVGPVLARRILDHRAMHGPFRDPRDLKAVRGIGPRLFERLRPLVRVEGADSTR